MARYCEFCDYCYADDMEHCPRCAAARLGVGRRNGKQRVQRSSPVAPALPALPPDTSAVALPTGPEAHIDLGSPVTGSGSEGPPSGASFISWTALLRRKKRARNATPPPGCIPVLAIQGAVPARAPAAAPQTQDPTPANDARLSHLLVGFLLGCALCLGLWLLGAEPPHAWRESVTR